MQSNLTMIAAGHHPIHYITVVIAPLQPTATTSLFSTQVIPQTVPCYKDLLLTSLPQLQVHHNP